MSVVGVRQLMSPFAKAIIAKVDALINSCSAASLTVGSSASS